MAGCIPVNRQIKDENAKSKALDILNNGYALGVFRKEPEIKPIPFITI